MLSHSIFVCHTSQQVISNSTAIENKPLILLDVDGVINMLSLPMDEQSKMWDDSTSNSDVNGYKIDYSPSVVKLINSWSSKADVQWLSAWNNRANQFLAPVLGLSPLQVARSLYPMPSKQTAFLKLADVDVNRPIIWIDDDLLGWKNRARKELNDPACNGTNGNATKSVILQQKIYFRPNTLYLSPRCGLRREHCDLVQQVLDDPSIIKDKVMDELEEGKRP